MNCSQCGSYQDSGAFCTRCGADMVTPQAYQGRGADGGGASWAPGPPPPPHGGYSPAPPPPPGAYPDPPGYGPSPVAYGTVGYSGGLGIRHLATEAHLLAMGLWSRIGGLFLLAMGGLFVVLALFSGFMYRLGSHGAEAGMMAASGALVGLIGILVYSLGTSLQRFSNAARLVAGALQFLWLVLILLQAVLMSSHPMGAAGLLGPVFNLIYLGAMVAVLFSGRAAEVCSPAYQDELARTPYTKASVYSSPFFWIPLIPLALAAMGIVLALTFAMAH